MPAQLVSVIIPNLNSPVLDRVLGALYAQEFEHALSLEVIVVGQDGPGCLRQFPQTTFIHTEKPVGPATARNIGIRRARGDFIACLDADCIPESNWLAEMLRAHAESAGRVIIGGAVKIEADRYWALADNLSSFHDYLPTHSRAVYWILPACNITVPRHVFNEVGFFDETFIINEDTDWMMRARRLGYSLVFNPSSRVWHRTPRGTLRALLLHAGRGGYYSIVNRHRYADVESVPFLLKYWWSVAIASPLIATGVTAKIYLRDPGTWRYAHVFPAIWIAKLAWCWGAAYRLRQGISSGTEKSCEKK